jgi:hypothetical protein
MRPADTTPAPVPSVGQLEHSKLSAARQGQLSRSGAAVLLVDHDHIHAARLVEGLSARNLHVELCHSANEAATKLRKSLREFAIVIVNISDVSQPWLKFLRVLREAAFQSSRSFGPFYLCVSTVKRDPHFELQIERTGARLIYER